jgi:hypothetical protein
MEKSVETIPGMEEGEKRRMIEGVSSSIIYLIRCKNICKCYNVLPTQHNKN